MKKWMGGVLLLFSLGVLVACGNSSNEDSNSKENDYDKIISSGKLKVGTSSGYAPYEFIDLNGSSTEIVGVDMAFGKKIADKLGVDLVVNDMTFSSILGSLTQGTIDIALAGMSITEERKQSVDFSDPYVESENRILTTTENAAKYTTIDDWKSLTLGAQKSTTQETIINESIKPANVVTLEKVPDLILELLTGKIDGIVVENTVAQQYLVSNSELAFSDAEIDKDYRYKYTAVAVKKGNTELVDAINEVIAESKESGDFDKWIKEYSEIAAKSAKTASE